MAHPLNCPKSFLPPPPPHSFVIFSLIIRISGGRRYHVNGGARRDDLRTAKRGMVNAGRAKRPRFLFTPREQKQDMGYVGQWRRSPSVTDWEGPLVLIRLLSIPVTDENRLLSVHSPSLKIPVIRHSPAIQVSVSDRLTDFSSVLTECPYLEDGRMDDSHWRWSDSTVRWVNHSNTFSPLLSPRDSHLPVVEKPWPTLPKVRTIKHFLLKNSL